MKVISSPEDTSSVTLEILADGPPADAVAGVVADLVPDVGRAVPVAQALSAIGEPDTTADLAHRLVATIGMLWSDVAGADLFIPQGGSGELRGVRDVTTSVALLSAVASPYAGEPAVQIIPVVPSLVHGGGGRGGSMSVPVLCGGRVEAFIIVQRVSGAPDFAPRDLEALRRLADGVGELLTRVRARGGRSVAAWLQRDMAQAREMQRQFLPQPPATNSANVRVLAEYLPAFAVGGDFYEFVDLGDGRVLAAIGDVSGKGVAAALMMSRISSELYRLARETSGPAELLARLNASLPPGMHGDRYATVVCVLLDMPKGRWTISNAGHVVPILRRRRGTVSGLAYASGPPIGMLADPQFTDESLAAEPGDILILATDGAFENLEGERRPCSTMGQCKLVEVIEKAPHDLADIHRSILSAVQSSSIGRDDVALLGLELGE